MQIYTPTKTFYLAGALAREQTVTGLDPNGVRIVFIARNSKYFSYTLLLFLLFSQVFPGTFPLEQKVNPTTQASSF
jgi:hypothetical protein